MIVFGTIGCMSMLGRYFLDKNSGSTIRVILHAFLVIGATMVLIGIDLVGKSLVLDYIIIIIVLLWLRTKMMLTKWEHRNICSVCNHPCNEAY